MGRFSKFGWGARSGVSNSPALLVDCCWERAPTEHCAATHGQCAMAFAGRRDTQNEAGLDYRQLLTLGGGIGKHCSYTSSPAARRKRQIAYSAGAGHYGSENAR